LTALKSVRVVEINLGDGTTKRSVTPGTPRAAAVLRALGITNREPPTRRPRAKPSYSDKPTCRPEENQ
jgi:hypothetical protein